MKKEGIDKVTEMVNKEVKSTSRGEKCLAKFTASNGNVYGSLTLDIRKAGDYSQPLPVAVRVCHAGQKVFLRLGKTYTMEEWLALCDYEKSGRRIQLTERNDMKNLMDRVELIANQLIAENNFSLRKLQDRFQGRKDDDSTIITVWDSYIQSKTNEGKAGSARCSKDVRNRFVKDLGTDISFADINRDFILKWVKIMKKNELSTTTIAIALRSLRTIINMCIANGLMKGDTKEMFKDTGYNKAQSRKHEFLDVATMRKLYDFWKADEAKDKDGNDIDKICARDFWKGRDSYRKLQDAYFNHVKSKGFDLERGMFVEDTDRKHYTVEEYKKITNYENTKKVLKEIKLEIPEVPDINEISKFSIKRDEKILKEIIKPKDDLIKELYKDNLSLHKELSKQSKVVNEAVKYQKERDTIIDDNKELIIELRN